MRNILIFLLVSFFLLPLGHKGHFQVVGPVKNNIDEFIFVKDSSVLFEFRYVNTGDSLLTISKVIPSCPCMAPSWSVEPLAPGDTGLIHVVYHAETPGHFRKILTVVSDGEPELSYMYVEGTAVDTTARM